MNKKSDQIIQLEKELAYYKKQVDLLSGSTLTNQYAFTQLSNVCRKYINGFQIIADIQRSYSFYSRKEVLYENFLEGILAQMFLDRVVLLEIIPGTNEMKPVLWKGYNEEESVCMSNISIAMPETFLEEKKSILVNNEAAPDVFEMHIQNSLLAPHFILTPLVKNQQAWGALYVAMQKDINTISYIPLVRSNINMFESLAGMISAMTQQLEQREEMEKERNRIARDMHDDIGSELSKISITCENLKQEFPERTDMLKDLDIIKDSTGSIVNNIGNIIWALNPVNNTLEGLMGYLREYAFEYLEMHQLAVVFDLPENQEDLVISHESRTHIFMVLKEALHNIVKHAAATSVEIVISIVSNKMYCSISDNGSGFSTERNSLFGNGLRNMQQRITETGGKFTVQSNYREGTRLQIEVPL